MTTANTDMATIDTQGDVFTYELTTRFQSVLYDAIKVLKIQRCVRKFLANNNNKEIKVQAKFMKRLTPTFFSHPSLVSRHSLSSANEGKIG